MHNLFKKVTALVASSVCMLTFVGISSHGDTDIANAANNVTDYELVTDASEITVGSKIFIANLDKTYAMTSTITSSNSKTKSLTGEQITVVDNKISSDQLKSTCIFTVESSGSSYAFKCSDGYLNGYGDNNVAYTLSFYDQVKNGSVWDFTIDSQTGETTLSNHNPKGARYLRFYGNKNLFSAYLKQSNMPICIFKEVVSYDVTFNTGVENIVVPTQSIKVGGKVQVPNSDILVRDGYIFNGWIDDATGEPFDFATTVTKAISLTANWVDVTSPRIEITKGITEVIKGNAQTLTAKYTNATVDKVDWLITEGVGNAEFISESIDDVGESIIEIDALKKGVVTVKAEITVNGKAYSDTITFNTYAHVIEKEQLTARNMLGVTYSQTDPVSYDKVTENLTDWTGRYLIIYEDATGYKALNTNPNVIGGAGNIIDTKITKGTSIPKTIEGIDFTNSIIDIVKSSNGGYFLKNNNNFISQNDKDLISGTSKPAKSFKISYDTKDKFIKITNASKYIQFNDSWGGFRCYTSGQKPIQLYKLDKGQITFTDVRARLEVKMPVDAYLSGDEYGVYVGTSLDKQGRVVVPSEKIVEGEKEFTYVFSVTGLCTEEKYNKDLFVTPFITVGGVDYKFTTYQYSAHSIADAYIKDNLAPEYTDLLNSLESTFASTTVEVAK